MKWSHLPVSGGLFDQDPDLLDAFRLIFNEQMKYEAEQQKKREQESKRRGSRPVAGRRRA